MKRDILITCIIYAIFILYSWMIILVGLGDVKRTKRVVERHPYFTYPWYKRLFCLGLNKHRYLTVLAFAIHICHSLLYVFAFVDYFIFEKITICFRIGAGFMLLAVLLLGLFMHLVLYHRKKGWKFNK